MEVYENDLYINLDSFYMQYQEAEECDDKIVKLERDLGNAVHRSFQFQIISNFMIFTDL